GPNRSNTVWNICRKNRGRIKRKKKRKKGSSSDGLTFSLAGRKSALHFARGFSGNRGNSAQIVIFLTIKVQNQRYAAILTLLLVNSAIIQSFQRFLQFF